MFLSLAVEELPGEVARARIAGGEAVEARHRQHSLLAVGLQLHLLETEVVRRPESHRRAGGGVVRERDRRRPPPVDRRRAADTRHPGGEGAVRPLEIDARDAARRGVGVVPGPGQRRRIHATAASLIASAGSADAAGPATAGTATGRRRPSRRPFRRRIRRRGPGVPARRIAGAAVEPAPQPAPALAAPPGADSPPPPQAPADSGPPPPFPS